MKPRDVAGPPADTTKESPQPAAASRGRRLGKGARRDIRWALRQHPGDSVREVTIHGVRITFTPGTTGKSDAHDDRRGERHEAGLAEERGRQSPTEEKLNSAQRRSKARAKEYYDKLREQDKPAPSGTRATSAGASSQPPPAASPDPPPAAPATPQEAAPAQGRTSANDDVPMQVDATSGNGLGLAAKGARKEERPGKGRGRGGSK